jgi:beta-glucosidase
MELDVTDATAAPSDARTAADIVAAMDLRTKVRMLSGRGFWVTEAVTDAGLDGVVLSDGPHGLRCQAGSSDHLGLAPAQPATCFPPAVTLGSTWDADLVRKVGEAIGDEAVAQGVSVVLGPGLNIKRHPAAGRNFEYYSEDPLLSGRLAAAWVGGVQSRGVGASAKHFAVNNQESHRLVVDALVDERTMRELYLTGFEIVVRHSQPWTVMCSYNRINGTYASDDRGLLTAILRDEWGFEGLVVSDWGATNDRIAAVRAGMDLEMPGSAGAFDGEVRAAVQDGRLAEADVDRCAERVVSMILRGQQPAERPSADLGEHHRLARRAAAEGSVLLVNTGVLPLRSAGRIAVVGGFATEPRYQGAGSSQVVPVQLDVPLDALRARVGDEATVLHAEGYDARTGASTPAQFDRALAVARDADVVVCFVGLPGAAESEGFDRTTLDLPADQLRLVEALASLPAPVVVVLNNGGVVHLPFADRVDALVECWLGGEAGGSAVVDVLFGDAEPAGRLAESIPYHVGQLPSDRNFPGDPKQVQYREGLQVGYRFHDTAGVPAQFPFGFGRSFTTFEWSDVGVEGDGTDLTVSVTVTNTGERAGSDVVQVYVRDVESSVPRPHKELKGFAKVHLAAGESERVTVALDRRSFAVWDVAAHDWLVEGGRFEIVVARSSADSVEVVGVDVDSPDRLAPDPRPVSGVATDDEFAAMLGRPVPRPDPVRPFHRNSTLEDMEGTRIGRALSAVVVREGVRRSAQEFPDPDDATLQMIRSAIREGPARGLALMSGGAVRLRQVDTLLDALNGRWSDAARSVVAQLRRSR